MVVPVVPGLLVNIQSFVHDFDNIVKKPPKNRILLLVTARLSPEELEHECPK